MGARLGILVPLGLLLVLTLFRLVIGRALTKRTFDTLLALLLLGYFLATASLGIFWVANQHLPVFDWHYWLGYLTLGLVFVHVACNWQALVAFFRKRSPKPLVEKGGRTWHPAVRTVGWIVGLAAYGGLFYWLGRGQAVSRIEITRQPQTYAALSEPTTTRPSAPPSAARMSTAGWQGSAEDEPVARPWADPCPNAGTHGSAAPRNAAELQGEADPRHPTLDTDSEAPATRPAAPIEYQMVRVEGESKARSLAAYYHQKVKQSRLSVMRGSRGLNWAAKPEVFKRYPRAEVVNLPPAAETAGMSVEAAVAACRRPVHGFSPEGVTLADVSTMLFMTNGITSTLRSANFTYHLRAAPSAGALYPTDIYVIARNIEGLPAGVYHYDVKQHRLHRLRHEENAADRLAGLVSQGHLVRQAPVTLVLASVFYRSGWKYAERSYRYCCLDAGHLAVQSALAAAALGYGSRPLGRFDDARVNAFLGLEEREEGALLVLPVGAVDESAAVPTTQPEFALATKDLVGKSDPLILLIHGNTELGVTGAAVRPLAPRLPEDKPYAELGAIALPTSPAEGDDLFRTIRRRRSVREWSDAAMTLQELSTVLYYAFGMEEEGHESGWDPSVEDNQALNLYVMVHDVQGLGPGVYYYRRGEHGLTPLRTGDFRGQSHGASLFQDAVGAAGAVLVMTMDPQRLGHPDGDRGYRYAALDAGMLGGRVYLATTGLQLGCCGIGAYFDDEVSELIGVSSDQEWVIYLAAIGPPEPGIP